MNKSNRDIFLHARLSSEEENLIKMKMEQAGIISLSAYLRKMALDGYVVKLDMAEVRGDGYAHAALSKQSQADCSAHWVKRLRLCRGHGGDHAQAA